MYFSECLPVFFETTNKASVEGFIQSMRLSCLDMKSVCRIKDEPKAKVTMVNPEVELFKLDEGLLCKTIEFLQLQTP